MDILNDLQPQVMSEIQDGMHDGGAIFAAQHILHKRWVDLDGADRSFLRTFWIRPRVATLIPCFSAIFLARRPWVGSFPARSSPSLMPGPGSAMAEPQEAQRNDLTDPISLDIFKN